MLTLLGTVALFVLAALAISAYSARIEDLADREIRSAIIATRAERRKLNRPSRLQHWS